MATKFMAPGVYIEEKDAFPGSVVEVATAVPAFIGYTEKANRNSESLINIPTRITSFKEYCDLFGGAFSPKFKLEPSSTDSNKPDKHLIAINGEEKAISYDTNHELYLFRSIQLFYNNGGSSCYIVSVKTYDKKPDGVEIKKVELLNGLDTLLKEQEPTIIVIPDAVKLSNKGCYDVYIKVLDHCANMQSRVAIFDIHNDFSEQIQPDGNVITFFRENIGTENLNYGAVYYPWLHTSIVPKGEITYENLDISIKLEELLPETKAKELIMDFAKIPSAEKNKEKKSNLHLALIATSLTYSDLINKITELENLLPPSAAMAGLYTMVDNTRGVWKTPANVSVKSVIKPSINITHNDQESLNLDAMSGKSINAIRTFPGVGTMVWGGRTLDGNSLDWRYINVRRTMVMLEQSIKLALRSYVFEPNDANTWVTVKSMIVNFLTDYWKQGALAGSSPEDAFEVQIGLGSTMTALDILEGKMLVSVKLAIVRPAEFIVVTFEQQMQKS